MCPGVPNPFCPTFGNRLTKGLNDDEKLGSLLVSGLSINDIYLPEATSGAPVIAAATLRSDNNTTAG